MPRTTAKKPARAATRSTPRAPRAKAPSTAIRSYRAAISFLNDHSNFERMLRVGYTPTNFNLARMQRLLSGLGNPHRTLRCIHIAGTKGKGSTAHMLASVLEESGLKVGLYTSPHFLDVRERLRIDGTLITEAEFARLIDTIAPVVRQNAKDGPTYFDILTCAALVHFVDKGVDIAVLETGLGGRLDSTNVCKPEVCAITEISLDHMAQLGNNVEDIATEKAGIFKPGVPVVSAPQTSGVRKVLEACAEKVGTTVKTLESDIPFSIRFESSRVGGPINRICMTGSSSRFNHIHVPLLGEHQAYNCGLVLAIVNELREQGRTITEQDVMDGLSRVHIRGRVETIRTMPRVVVDGAHNASSIRALMRAIGQNISYDSMVVIFGCSMDKDIPGMLKQLQLGADKVIFTTARTSRAADAHELAQQFSEISPKMAMVEPRLEDAFLTASRSVTREDLICVTGSVYLVGEAIRKLAE